MPKTRFTSADVTAMAHEAFRTFEGKRVINIYDVSDKSYLVKFVGSGDSEKSFLLLESGVRFHKTKYLHTPSQLPSPFAMILRKYLRTKRLDRIDQLGMDRVVDFKFGSGESANHIILELYSSGNLVLTDANYEVLALLRSHQFSEEQILKVGEIYPISCTINLASLTGGSAEVTNLQTAFDFTVWLKQLSEKIKDEQSSTLDVVDTSKGKKKKAPRDTSLYLRQVLLHKTCCLSFLGPDIIDNCLLKANLDLNMKLDSFESKSTPEHILNFIEAVRDATSITLRKLEQGGAGYITMQTMAKDSQHSKLMDEFTPILLKQHEKKIFNEYSSFSEAVDEFFNAIDQQRAEKEQESRITAAQKKFDKVRRDQQKAIDTLVQQQVYLQNCAMLLEMRAEEVDKVRLVINSALAADMSWPDVEAMVEAEQKKGNPLASRISRMKLEDGKIFLKYSNKEMGEDFDSSDDEASVESKRKDEYIELEVDLDMSAYANAAKLYSNKKVAQVKEVKTVTASEKVLTAAEEQMKKVASSQRKNVGAGKVVRKADWFEKFNWFVTSEGFLAVSGHDQQQNEVIIKRFVKPCDILVTADVRGALPCFVFAKSLMEDDEVKLVKVSPLAIQEAGVAVVCRSSAWSAKQLVSAYWVKVEQISKQDHTGCTLPIGLFQINGKKHFLPPMPLEMGFGIMFRIDEESAKRHCNDRKLRDYDELESLTSTVMDRFEKYNISFEEEVLETVEEENEDLDGISDNEPETRVKSDTQEMEDTLDPEANEGDQLISGYILHSEQSCSSALMKESDEGTDEIEEMQREKISKKTSKTEKYDDQTSTTSTKESFGAKSKKKNLNRKKARRYAEQDEEDVELAMMVLGHASKKSGKTMQNLKDEKSEQKRKQDMKAKQSRAGVNLIKGDWSSSLTQLSEEIRAFMEELVSSDIIDEGGIDADVIKDLSFFPCEIALKILREFSDSKNLSKVVNKSSLLAGIMRTTKKELAKNKAAAVIKPGELLDAEVETTDHVEDNEEDQVINRNDADVLTESPLSQDHILFALPVCAPYISMQKFKYKVKLTPGSLKKGKAIKQVLELLPRVKEAGEVERSRINAIAPNEMLAVMISDVKLAAPGLHQQVKHKRQRGQKS